MPYGGYEDRPQGGKKTAPSTTHYNSVQLSTTGRKSRVVKVIYNRRKMRRLNEKMRQQEEIRNLEKKMKRLYLPEESRNDFFCLYRGSSLERPTVMSTDR